MGAIGGDGVRILNQGRDRAGRHFRPDRRPVRPPGPAAAGCRQHRSPRRCPGHRPQPGGLARRGTGSRARAAALSPRRLRGRRYHRRPGPPSGHPGQPGTPPPAQPVLAPGRVARRHRRSDPPGGRRLARGAGPARPVPRRRAGPLRRARHRWPGHTHAAVSTPAASASPRQPEASTSSRQPVADLIPTVARRAPAWQITRLAAGLPGSLPVAADQGQG